MKSDNFVILIINYKIIKFEYKLNLNINKKLLIVFIFKGKEYIIIITIIDKKSIRRFIIINIILIKDY